MTVVESSHQNRQSRGHRLWFVIVLVLFAALVFIGAHTRIPVTDEAGLANPGYNLAYHGFPGTTVIEPAGFMPLSLKKWTYWHFPAYFYVTAGWYKIVGFGLMQVRLLSLIFSLLGLVSWYWIARNLSGSAEAGLIAMSLVAADYFYMLTASRGRMEMMDCSLGAAALASYLIWRKTSLAWAVFAGHAFVTFSILTHPVCGFYYICLLLLILSLDARRISPGIVGIAAIPVVIGMSLLGAYIFHDFPAFQDQMRSTIRSNFNAFNDSGLSSVPVVRLLQLEWRHRYMEPFGMGPGESALLRLKMIILASYLAGIVGNIWSGIARANRGQMLMGLMAVIAALYLALVSPSKYSYYLAHVTAFYAASLGVFLCSLPLAPRWKRRIVSASVLFLAVPQLGGTIYDIHRDGYHRIYLPAVEAIRRNTTPQSLIMAPAELWFALEPDRRIILDFDLGRYSGAVPDVFVLDPATFRRHNEARTAAPAVFAFEQSLIDASREVYRNDYYTVYVRR